MPLCYPPARIFKPRRTGGALGEKNEEANYRREGTVGFTPSEVIVPFRATANYVGASCVAEPFVLFGTEGELTDNELEAGAATYLAWLRELRRAGA